MRSVRAVLAVDRPGLVRMTRLIIASDLDDLILRREDAEAWAQRMLWFAEPGDAIVLMTPPDAAFLAHVASVKGFDPGELTVHVVPAERWPVRALLAQGACEPLNNRVDFRARAAAAGAPIPRGADCLSKDEAVRASVELLARTRAIVVKKAHGGAGAGNHIVTTSAEVELERAGAEHVTLLDGSAASVASFWDEHWEWASAGGLHPVVVEEFPAGSRSIYAQFDCAAEAARFRVIGELSFLSRRLERETVPAQGVSEFSRDQLLGGAQRIADYYWARGHRGPMRVEAAVGPGGHVVFTGTDSQYPSATNLYRMHCAEAGDDRVVTQLTTPPSWPIASTEDFLAAVAAAGCSFDPVARRGIVAVTPRIGADNLGPLVLGVIHAPDEDVGTTLARLDPVLAVLDSRREVLR